MLYQHYKGSGMTSLTFRNRCYSAILSGIKLQAVVRVVGVLFLFFYNIFCRAKDTQIVIANRECTLKTSNLLKTKIEDSVSYLRNKA